jgi:hypothetical protein
MSVSLFNLRTGIGAADDAILAATGFASAVVSGRHFIVGVA